eukprot:TRINITY_DN87_c7_g1_i1.p1 TRINITY_DN87_c7_g1~~TRINITY_DN87_c7_g1_i1.p1  ORF type:complete len:539 (-),score=188.53 TRINITY_DN87_c7_g1_i1:190-1647(-)
MDLKQLQTYCLTLARYPGFIFPLDPSSSSSSSVSSSSSSSSSSASSSTSSSPWSTMTLYSLFQSRSLLDSTTILFRSPVSRYKSRPKKEAEKEEKVEEKKTKKGKDELSVDEKKYASFTNKNAIGKLTKAYEKASAKSKELKEIQKNSDLKTALEYAEMNFAELYKERKKEMHALPSALLCMLLSSDRLNTGEEDEPLVLNVVKGWSRANSKSTKKEEEDTKEEATVLKEVGGDSLWNCIRWPIMPVGAIATHSSLFLESQQCLDLFTYAASRKIQDSTDDEKSYKKKQQPSLPKSLASFSAKCRVPVVIGLIPEWDFSSTKTAISNWSLTDKRTIRRSSGGDNWYIAQGKDLLPTKGVQRFAVKVVELGPSSNTWKLEIGVVNSSSTANLSTDVVSGYTYIAATGNTWGTSSDPYSTAYAEGDTITVEVDQDKHEVTFYRNTTNLGVAFHNVVTNLYPIVASSTTNTTLQFVPVPRGLSKTKNT